MEPTHYEITVKGTVGPKLLDAFEGLSVSTARGETRLHGPVADQAALHGLLELVESLGLELLVVRRTGGPR